MAHDRQRTSFWTRIQTALFWGIVFGFVGLLWALSQGVSAKDTGLSSQDLAERVNRQGGPSVARVVDDIADVMPPRTDRVLEDGTEIGPFYNHLAKAILEMPYDANRALAFVVSDTNGCHACPGLLTTFDYRKTATGWALVSYQIGAGVLGSWGGIPDAEFGLFEFRPGAYGFHVTTSDMGQGILSEGIHFFVPSLQGYTEAGEVMVTHDGLGGLFPFRDETEISFHRESTKFGDDCARICLTTTGVEIAETNFNSEAGGQWVEVIENGPKTDAQRAVLEESSYKELQCYDFDGQRFVF
ncbi:hypothetical protein [Tropicibacter naphthalenivorans]|uniref:Uncharacterized protein n=1 Tax=Tropicibacter naphthalenivorans TaxID=441103 RepID=A0A0P1GC20_9RHOB|nr:hypothetical protein [Tropicibacter naphthalenivorans]CUH78885.1 hypothetical protein TRN7648_02218 [Tropicibacter naphthalenivorans]SMC82154.1 hypothetical protein SAMN04488093_104380 [Tropicibacter naphthalenivorans]